MDRDLEYPEERTQGLYIHDSNFLSPSCRSFVSTAMKVGGGQKDFSFKCIMRIYTLDRHDIFYAVGGKEALVKV